MANNDVPLVPEPIAAPVPAAAPVPVAVPVPAAAPVPVAVPVPAAAPVPVAVPVPTAAPANELVLPKIAQLQQLNEKHPGVFTVHFVKNVSVNAAVVNEQLQVLTDTSGAKESNPVIQEGRFALYWFNAAMHQMPSVATVAKVSATALASLAGTLLALLWKQSISTIISSTSELVTNSVNAVINTFLAKYALERAWPWLNEYAPYAAMLGLVGGGAYIALSVYRNSRNMTPTLVAANFLTTAAWLPTAASAGRLFTRIYQTNTPSVTEMATFAALHLVFKWATAPPLRIDMNLLKKLVAKTSFDVKDQVVQITRGVDKPEILWDSTKNTDNTWLKSEIKSLLAPFMPSWHMYSDVVINVEYPHVPLVVLHSRNELAVQQIRDMNHAEFVAQKIAHSATYYQRYATLCSALNITLGLTNMLYTSAATYAAMSQVAPALPPLIGSAIRVLLPLLIVDDNFQPNRIRSNEQIVDVHPYKQMLHISEQLQIEVTRNLVALVHNKKYYSVSQMVLQVVKTHANIVQLRTEARPSRWSWFWR